MKKLTKIMLSLAAAATVTAAMAVTAMAVDTITGTYDNTTGQVTMDGVIGSGKSQTILVLDSNEDIAYINQIDNNGQFSTFMLAAGLQSTTPVTYNIKIGGTDKSLQTGTLTIAADAPATVTIIIGDADGNGKINMTDVNRIGRYVTKKTTGTGLTGQEKTKTDGTKYIIGDADGNSKINMTDVNRVGRYVTKKTTGTGNTGQEVVVLDESSAE
jgi:hypothetical protein